MSHSVRRSVCVWKFCYRPPYIHDWSLLAHSVLFEYVSISLSVKGQPHPAAWRPAAERKTSSSFNSAYVNLISTCP